MNKSEKQRIKKLDKVFIMTNKICDTKKKMYISAALAAVMGISMFMPAITTNELWAAALAVIILSYIISVGMCVIGSAFDYKNGMLANLQAAGAAGGTYTISAFAATLPFKASDLRLLRLERCKKQVLTMGIITAAVIAAVSIAGFFGYETYSGLVGLFVLATVLLEIIFLAASFIFTYMGTLLTAMTPAMAFPVTLVVLFATPEDITVEQAAAMSERLSGLSILSGFSGIVILAVLLFAAVKAAEFFLTRSKNISWKL